MCNLTNVINVTDILPIFTDKTSPTFYSTLASVSIVLIIVIFTFYTHMVSTINKNVHKKEDEIEKYNLEVYEYDRKNEKIKRRIGELIQPDDTFKDEKEYRRCSESLINNNLSDIPQVAIHFS